MADAAARFTLKVVEALKGDGNPCVCAYVDTDNEHNVPFLALPIILGKTGIIKRLPMGTLHESERKLLANAYPIVKTNIDKGIQFAKAKL